MRIIKILSDQICEEIDGAKDYAINALEYRDIYPDLSKFYHSTSQIEYEHAEKLHEFVQKRVTEAKDSGRTYPEEMLEKWEQKHRECIIKMKDAKVFIDMY